MPRCGPPNEGGIPSALPVGDHHVGAVGAGRAEQAERNRIGHDDQQRAGAVHRLGQAVDRLALAEEVGILDDQCGGVLVKQRLELIEIGRAVLVADDGRRVGAAQVGLDHRAVLRMDGRRQHDLAALARMRH